MDNVRVQLVGSLLSRWLLERGILFALIQTPLIALMVGYFFRLTPMPTANAFTVMLAFILFPVWILVRKHRSQNPDEPIHHLHKYALYALIPYVVYNFARIPTHYLLSIVFWDHWYDFGYELTGQPVDRWGSLIPGTFLHSLQGYTLVLGFYVLYRRHSLINALIYIFIGLSVIYTWTFPTYVLVDYQPPFKWFFVVWWAHFWMAIAAWYVPKVVQEGRLLRYFRRGWAGIFLIVGLVLLYFLPFAFVFWRAATWQFPLQHAIDQANFKRVQLVLKEGPVLTAVEQVPGRPTLQQAHYAFMVRFGPRSYKDYIAATKALDAGPVKVSGVLTKDGSIVAWCSAYVPALETPNNLLNPAEYFPALKRMEFTDIPVECTGPAATAAGLHAAAGPARVSLDWYADLTLVGDREHTEWRFEGHHEDLALEITE